MFSKLMIVAASTLSIGSALHADAGTQINACITNAPNDGVCDFRGAGTVVAAETIYITKPVTLLLDGTQLILNGSPGIAVASNGVRIRGTVGRTQLIQGTVGNNVIGGSALSDLEVQGISFVGIPGTVPQYNNNGIALSAKAPGMISAVRVVGNTFTGFRMYAVVIQNASDVEVVDNTIAGVADGIRFSGVVRGKIIHNFVHDTQLPSTIFTVAIGLDSTNTNFPICSNIEIAQNTVLHYVNAEGILVHAGQNITISNNILDDVLLGIAVQPFNKMDDTHDIIITGNAYTGAALPGAAAQTGNYGIFVGGGPKASIPSHVIVANNKISKANEVVRNAAQGGIGVGYSNDVTIDGNSIHDTESNGISLTNPNSQIVIVNNFIDNVVSQSGKATHGIYGYSGVQTGRIESNFVSNATNAYQFDVASPDLLFGSNDAANIATKIAHGSNVTITR
jgi:hypothetical protein